jgi:hypothetical protein
MSRLGKTLCLKVIRVIISSIILSLLVLKIEPAGSFVKAYLPPSTLSIIAHTNATSPKAIVVSLDFSDK